MVVHYGKMGVAVDPWLAARWSAGGSTVVQAKGWRDGVRAFALKIPGKGWKPGVQVLQTLMCATQPKQTQSDSG